jgi:formate dehydrogenase iron-sulfur subunit
MVEVEINGERHAYGPVTEEDVNHCLMPNFTEGKASIALSLGKTEQIPFLKNQERLTFARIGITDPVSLDDYLAHEGYVGLKNALKLSQEQIVQHSHGFRLARTRWCCFPDRNQMEHGTQMRQPGRKSTSSAMPMKAIRVLSPIAW